MVKSLQDKLARALSEREEAGTLRALKVMKGIDFSSNDYLGLAKLSLAITDEVSGSTGSRLITGEHDQTSQLESYLLLSEYRPFGLSWRRE